MTTHHSEPGRTYRGADPQQRQQERRIRLLDAAVKVFGTTGYRTATVEKVCSEAGLTKRYFYESFSNSEDLLMAAYGRATDAMRENILAGAQAEADSTEQVLRGALTGFFTFVAENPASARIAFVEILGVSPTVDALYRKTTTSFSETVLQVAEAAGSSRGLAGPNRRTLAMGLVGAVLTIAQQWLLSPEREPLDSVIASAHTILAAVVFGRVDS
ncbi:TetR/AcrR family transcriptional regulator [Rhodococcus sp. IEGM 1401]|uniref:TetR/AcrR family transcriptional regulator n=1 Tax=unclassified Rhodococcus (in: high G+C Gram-positive bacteria) TaxID=192944 RepID=UPI0011EE3E92|nr:MULTISPECIES: TetR/AcrR family transcriptional regulator [unclassified Rhodococcus (in: high G+C Gram-positive bacteria)]KAA0924936.1 TetR/AcrR family transcriptional regulator [Rhodococcus sp. ANT_H53B]MCZ4562936.1 TetR/AcrR family transcriptional regulator [Rhodococcus sp. IEGM 1401]MDI9923033.1 TetR/AcrR family transcriptional regulator [Rhodococcus sp. IEGM 1372]MDI9927744.1 TetR/AcrR family transcriptional regulator [Rhodococcus sp. IEGM 1341]MDV8035606.1 TetR/AcrR family transcription